MLSASGQGFSILTLRRSLSEKFFLAHDYPPAQTREHIRILSAHAAGFKFFSAAAAEEALSPEKTGHAEFLFQPFSPRKAVSETGRCDTYRSQTPLSYAGRLEQLFHNSDGFGFCIIGGLPSREATFIFLLLA